VAALKSGATNAQAMHAYLRETIIIASLIIEGSPRGSAAAWAANNQINAALAAAAAYPPPPLPGQLMPSKLLAPIIIKLKAAGLCR